MVVTGVNLAPWGFSKKWKLWSLSFTMVKTMAIEFLEYYGNLIKTMVKYGQTMVTQNPMLASL